MCITDASQLDANTGIIQSPTEVNIERHDISQGDAPGSCPASTSGTPRSLSPGSLSDGQPDDTSSVPSQAVVQAVDQIEEHLQVVNTQLGRFSPISPPWSMTDRHLVAVQASPKENRTSISPENLRGLTEFVVLDPTSKKDVNVNRSSDEFIRLQAVENVKSTENLENSSVVQRV